MMLSSRTIVLWAVFLIGMPIIAVVGRQMILKDTPAQHQPASPTETAISEAISDPATPNDSLKENVDYRITEKKYFQDENWLVATIELIEQQVEPATVVMTRTNGGDYTIVLGPGTDFPADDLPDMPADVVNHLRASSRINDTAP